jgi:hypothetical protein
MEDHAQGQSEWERATELRETGVRSRLRGLFAPTDAGDAVADLIEVHGRELERRSEKLLTAVHDLERREERARELHTRVEQILREGSAELDSRQAELNIRAEQLEAREAAVARAEERIAERASELGAVELRRAAVERREETVRTRAIELERQAEELTALAARLEGLGTSGREPEDAPTPDDGSHVALTAGYRLLERDGPAPAPGEVVERDDGVYRCLRVTASPLPGDRRRCALLERSHEPDER